MGAASVSTLGSGSTYAYRDNIFNNEIPIVRTRTFNLFGAGGPKSSGYDSNGCASSSSDNVFYGAGSGGSAFCIGNSNTIGESGNGGGGLAIYAAGDFSLDSGYSGDKAKIDTTGGAGSTCAPGGGGGSVLVIYGGSHSVSSGNATINTAGGAAGGTCNSQCTPTDGGSPGTGGRGFYAYIPF